MFTSGATEANHLAIVGGALAARPHGGHVVTTTIEHKAVLAACQYLVDHHGYTCTRVDVDSHGSVRPDDVIAALKPDTVLVSVMHANNEIGTIQRIEAIAEVVHHRRILMHTDAAQSAYYGLIDTSGLDADFVSLSAHKLYGPKGIGALFVRGRTRLTALQTGGGQERGLRAGDPQRSRHRRLRRRRSTDHDRHRHRQWRDPGAARPPRTAALRRDPGRHRQRPPSPPTAGQPEHHPPGRGGRRPPGPHADPRRLHGLRL